MDKLKTPTLEERMLKRPSREDFIKDFARLGAEIYDAESNCIIEVSEISGDHIFMSKKELSEHLKLVNEKYDKTNRIYSSLTSKFFHKLEACRSPCKKYLDIIFEIKNSKK